MLSSRYLHLHEALGLGPMWLNQNAKIIHAAPQTAASAAPVRPKAIAADTAQAVRTLSAGAHQARTAAIANSANGQTCCPRSRNGTQSHCRNTGKNRKSRAFRQSAPS